MESTAAQVAPSSALEVKFQAETLRARQPAFDGESIYFANADHQDVVRVDSETFTVTGTVEPLGVNAVLVDGDSLWIARGQPHNVVQRFDIESG